MFDENRACEYPQVMLLGSGLNQAFGGASWEDFLEEITTKKEIQDKKIAVKDIKCPEPLKAIILTDDHVDIAMKVYCKNKISESIDGEFSGILNRVLTMGFDEILTTNYTYELEKASVFPKILTKNRITKMMKHTSGSKIAESQYLLHTYNEVKSGNFTNRVWHIHGEARKPDSTVLGHYYYGNLMYKIKKN